MPRRPPARPERAASLATAVLLVVLTHGMASWSAAQDPPAGPPLRPLVLDTQARQRIRVVPLATGLEHPWSLAFLPDGRSMLVTERLRR